MTIHKVIEWCSLLPCCGWLETLEDSIPAEGTLQAKKEIMILAFFILVPQYSKYEFGLSIMLGHGHLCRIPVLMPWEEESV